MAGIAGLGKDRAAGATAAGRQPAPLSFRIKPSHVRTLLWLRWKLTVRGYTRSWQRVLGLVFTLLLFVVFASVAGVGSVAAYLSLPRPAAAQVLFGALGALFLIWAVLPLLQYSLNEGLDVTKLQAYPLTRGEQMASLVLATLLDVSTLFILALYAAVVVGWHATPLATVFTIVALLAAYVHTVGFSQLVLAALMGLLRSRRYRDLAVVFFAVIGTSCSIINQVFLSRLSRQIGPREPAAILSDLHLDRILQWTPPGMAAKAITLADAGRYIEALPWLLVSLALVPLLLAVWAWVLDRGITNAESAGAGRARRGARARAATVDQPSSGTLGGAVPASVPAATPARARRWRPLRGPALAIARKDVLYIWRDPQLKAALLSSLLATVFIFIPNLYGGRSGSDLAGPATVLFAPLPALLVVLVLGLNAFGLERQALQTLFLYPLRPLDVFWGKNLVTGGIAVTVAVALTLLKAALTGGWSYVPLALSAGLAAVLVMLGCGNVTSVLTPFRARAMRMGETSTMSSENGCLRSVISTVALAVAAVLLLPVGLAVAAPLLLEHSEWLFISLPLAVLYGLALHQIATRLIAPVLLRRAPEILAVTVREA